MKNINALTLAATQEQVIEYLELHPTFFNDKPELIAQLILNHDEGAGTISLIERQVRIFREQSELYQQQLEDIIRVARENEQINLRMHKMTLELMIATEFEEVLNILHDQMRDHFRAEFLQLHLFEGHSNLAALEAISPLGKPRCGRLTQQHIQTLFPEHDESILSVAIIPLRNFKQHGLMAIGSPDENRFQLGMGTDYLSRLGELVGKALDVVSH